MNANELPQYKCHKIVRAAKITGVEPGGLAVIVDMGKVSASIEVPEGWVAKHDPLQGDGYVVAYEDGYLSWSPAAAFEAGYHRIPELGTNCGSVGDESDDFPDVKTLQEAGKCTASADWALADNGIDLEAADFSDALMWLKEGKRVSRSGWNGKGMFLLLIAGGAWGFECDVEGVDGHVASAFICMKTADNKLVPWFASQTDLLSTDWHIYEEVVSDIPPHQLRVLEELAKLTDRLDKLTAFFDTAIYQSLDVDERGRLKEQCALMGELQRVLAERVAAF